MNLNDIEKEFLDAPEKFDFEFFTPKFLALAREVREFIGCQSGDEDFLDKIDDLKSAYKHLECDFSNILITADDVGKLVLLRDGSTELILQFEIDEKDPPTYPVLLPSGRSRICGKFYRERKDKKDIVEIIGFPGGKR